MRTLSEAFFQTLNSNQVCFLIALMKVAKGVPDACNIYLVISCRRSEAMPKRR